MVEEPTGRFNRSELQSVILHFWSDMPALGQTMVLIQCNIACFPYALTFDTSLSLQANQLGDYYPLCDQQISTSCLCEMLNQQSGIHCTQSLPMSTSTVWNSSKLIRGRCVTHVRGAWGREIISSSVHNQRIKRLWHDMHRCEEESDQEGVAVSPTEMSSLASSEPTE